MLLQPSLDVLRVPFNPGRLCADGVTALGERLIEALGALLGEEFFDILDMLLMREA